MSFVQRTQSLHLRIGRIVVDADVIGPGHEARRAFEAQLVAAITQQFAGAAASSEAGPTGRVASALVPVVSAHLDAHRVAAQGTSP